MTYHVELMPGVSLTKVDDRSVLFSKKTGDFYGLNNSGAWMVRELLASGYEQTLANAATAFQGVASDKLATDLTTLVDHLAKLKLLKKLPS